MKKLLIIASLILIVVLASVVIAWWWLATTQSGAQWTLNQASRVAPGLEWERVEGGFASGVTIHGLRYADGELDFRARRVELAVRVQPRPRPRVRIAWLRVDDSDLRLPAAADPPPEPAPLEMPDIDLPASITLEQLRIRDFRLWPHGAEEPLTVDEFSLAARADERVEIERLDIQAMGARLRGELAAGLTDPWPLDGRLVMTYRADEEAAEQTLSLDLAGNLSALELDFRARGPVDAAGRTRVTDLIGDREVEIDLESDRAGWPRVPVRVADMELNARGSLAEWGLDSRFRLLLEDVPEPVRESRWALAVSGSGSRVELTRGRVDVLSGHVDLSGNLALEDPLRAEARAELVELDVAPLYPDMPVDALISGHLETAYADNAVELRAFRLRAPPTTLELTGSGHLRPQADEVDLEVNWTDFAWPPVAAEEPALLRSSQGRLTVDGKLSDWRAQLDALIQAPDVPEATVAAAATGSLTRADVQRARVETDSGSLELDGWVDWENDLRARADIRASGLDPSLAHSNLAGHLDGDFGVELALAEHLDLDLEIRRLQGAIRGRDLAGSGRLSLRDGQPGPGRVQLSLGANEIEIGSQGGQDWDFDLAAERLDQLWPDLGGRMHLTGTLDPAGPGWQATGQGRDIRYGDYVLDELDLATAGSLADDSDEISLDLVLRHLDLNPWERIDELELALDGTCREHGFRFFMDGTRARVDLAGQGELESCLPAEVDWQMRLDSLELANTPAGDWRLARPASFRLAGEQVSLDDFCLQPVDPRAARLCLTDIEQGPDGGRGRIELVELPVDLLLLPFDPGVRLGNELEGHLEARWTAAGLEQADGLIEIGRGRLRGRGMNGQTFELHGGRLRIATPEAGRIELDTRLDGEAESEIVMQAVLVDSRDLAGAEFSEGLVSFKVPELEPLGYLVPQVDRIAGALELELEFAGALARPHVNGRLALRDGALDNVPLGMHLSDIQVDSYSETDRLFIDGSFQAGDGRGALQATLGLENGAWFAETSLEGSDLDLFSVDWLSIRISPDLQVRLDAEETRIGGRVDIPRARIGLPPGMTERVSESDDVVRVGVEQEEPESAPRAVRLAGSLTIGLGDDVRFTGAGARARLAGSTELNWTGDDLIPLARGTIRLPEGSYRAYGQNLELQDSRVVFGNRPANDPVLEVEAVREVFGDPVVELAGVRIRGSVNNPEIVLFTDPPTTEEKALAYIVTGADFDHAAGVGAVSFGFYLFPQLFVSYGYGLFESGNVLSARYELSRRWGVRVESGERDTGVDFSFQIDR